MTDTKRDQFEAWITAPPFEKDIVMTFLRRLGQSGHSLWPLIAVALAAYMIARMI